MPEFLIKPARIRNFVSRVVRFLNSTLSLLGLKKKKNFWGIVYDSESKQPLDPAVVKLIKIGAVLETQMCITDIAGRYGFLVPPGKYKILAKKVNYTFPSEKVTGNSDGMFTDLYKGEVFEVYGESEVVGPNIPMDPVSFDWNQQAKLKYINTHPFWRLSYDQAVSTVFYAYLITTGIFSFRDVVVTGEVQFDANSLGFLVSLVILIFSRIMPPTRLYGQVLEKKSGRPVEGITLELANESVPTAIVGKAVTNNEGKFFIRMNKGRYLLRFVDNSLEKKDALGSLTVDVSSDGVVNQGFYLTSR